MRLKQWTPIGLIMVVLIGLLAPSFSGAQTRDLSRTFTESEREAIARVEQLSEGFSAVARLVTPSVVTITGTGQVKPVHSVNPFHFFRDDEDRGSELQPARTLGSGVVFRNDGYILTNNHVVRGMSELTVIDYEGDEWTAELIGVDPRTDLAVLKIDSFDHPPLPIGDSEALHIGEWVLAVGSPFSANLNTTITAGIVSAMGRTRVGLNDYENYIQTDAAINPGNSGGALVNMRGELVGINSAIASRSGSSAGIGFSIPTAIVLDVLDDLIQYGKVTRGYLGVGIQAVDQDAADALGLESRGGILIQRVESGSAAYEAGMKQGDVLVELNGVTIHDIDSFRYEIGRSQPGTVVDLTVLRNGKMRKLRAELTEYQTPSETAGNEQPEPTKSFGMSVEPITPQLERRLQLQETEGSLAITEVTPGSAADDKGLKAGDIILEVNQEPVASIREFLNQIEERGQDRPVLLLIQRGESQFFAALRRQ